MLSNTHSCGPDFGGPFQRGLGHYTHLGQGRSSFLGPFLSPHPSHGIFLLRKPVVYGADVVIAVGVDRCAGRRSRSLSRLVAWGGSW